MMNILTLATVHICSELFVDSCAHLSHKWIKLCALVCVCICVRARCVIKTDNERLNCRVCIAMCVRIAIYVNMCRCCV